MEQERNDLALHRAAPKEIIDCLKDLNPHYAIRALAYTENCQRCVVIAYEVRRRGYFTHAKPYIGGKADLLPFMDAQQGWPAVFQGQTAATCGALTQKQAQENVGHQMHLFGNHSRAIVKFNWLHRVKGHLFMAENIDDAIYFAGPQTGDDDVSRYFQHIDPNRVVIMRTDCARLTGLARQCCDP